MPVPDLFVIAPDFQLCEMCEKCYPDNEFCLVAIDNDKKGAEHQKRVYVICKDCREKCKQDPAYEKYVTDKTFKLKLGRLMKLEGKNE